MSRKKTIDKKDLQIMRLLSKQGNMTNVDLSKAVKLSAGPALKRVKSLSEEGYIEDVQARINLRKLGFDYCVFLTLSVNRRYVDQLIGGLNTSNFVKSVFRLAPEDKFGNWQRVLAIAINRDEDEFISVFGEFFSQLTFDVTYSLYIVDKIEKDNLNIGIDVDPEELDVNKTPAELRKEKAEK